MKMTIFILQFPHQNTKIQEKLILSVDVDSSQPHIKLQKHGLSTYDNKVPLRLLYMDLRKTANRQLNNLCSATNTVVCVTKSRMAWNM